MWQTVLMVLTFSLASSDSFQNSMRVSMSINEQVDRSQNESAAEEPKCPKNLKLYWNTTNSIFRIDNTDHIIDVNRGCVGPWQHDRVNFICPYYPRSVPFEFTERFIIYAVTKDEYDSCHVRENPPRKIAMCDDPYEYRFFTITFRSFTPIPGGIEFKPGHDYHFISTSSRDKLNETLHGMCLKNNMRVVFKVASSENDVKSSNPGDDKTTSTHPPVSDLSPDVTSTRKIMSYDEFLREASLVSTKRPPRVINNIPDFGQKKSKSGHGVKQEASTSNASAFNAPWPLLVLSTAVFSLNP